jgi:glycerophosphoryl diester phosphodiesterase
MKTLLIGLVLAVAGEAGAAESRPLVIAHRADYIEQDLVLTKDDVPVVLHDIYLDTVSDVAKRFPEKKRADGRFYALDLTLAELKQLRVAERFNAKTGKRVFAKRYPSDTAPGEFRVSTLEEELQLIQGLNQSTGRAVGIYPEIKQPKWHRDQGHDISKIVLPILARYGYATKADACFLQCFELAEVKRIRSELGWKGRLVMLIEAKAKGEDGTDHEALCTVVGLRDVAKVVDGFGPSIGRIVTWTSATEKKLTTLVADAHAAGLVVHPYTIRVDELPKNCPSAEALHAAVFREAKADGVFTDFTDVTLAWLRAP